MRRSQIVCLRLYPLRIPLRRSFKHAAHTRTTADPLIVEIELADGTLGYGETLPRPYVSGETLETVIEAIQNTFLDELATFRPQSFAEALERVDALPTHDEIGTIVSAARAGVELGALDAYSRHFEKPMGEVIGWLGLPGFGAPGSSKTVTYSGVLSGDDIRRLPGSIRKMRLYGLRDFKLKVGYDDDIERVEAVARKLGWKLQAGRCTLRLDANGAWTPNEAGQRLTALASHRIAAVEQPFERGQEIAVVALKRTISVPIMHDESLVTQGDAERLLSLRIADAFNIRISKNGGLLPSIRLAHFCRKHDIFYQLGCMVGETSVLSAVGRFFLLNVPGVRFAEGSYGRFLLTDDVVERPVRFGWGGRPGSLPGLGWGVSVRREQLARYVVPGTLEMPL